MNNDFIEMNQETEVNTWEINTDGLFKKVISKTLKDDDFSEDSIANIFDNAARILAKCPNPRTPTSQGKTGILIGKVQSGKTSTFISLIALALDNDYKISIVFGGNKNNLLKQNAERIKNAFGINDPDKLVVLTTKSNAAILNAEQIRQFVDRGSKVIIVALKHQKHINQVSQIFENSSIKEIPTLIVDDEGDQATLNTKYSKSEMSTIYHEVVKLKNNINKHCFISITATPQANILIDQCDILSPDFGELIYPGDGYCGLNEFHGEDEDKYIKVIPNSESNIIDGQGIPATFIKALACFFTGGALRRYRGDHRRHAMLIHPSQKTYDHDIVIKKVQTLLTKWQEKAKKKLNGVDDISYENLQKELLEAYTALQNDGTILPEFCVLENTILEIIKDCSPVHLCNSTNDTSADADLYKANIFVGGNMVERGITIKGLAVTYITRRAQGISNVDNTEQRARWFGYKKEYIDVCRVFTTWDIKKDFAAIFEHEEELWGMLYRAQHMGIQFKDIPRIFKLNSSVLRLTRQNVAKSKRLDSYSDWKKQSHFLFNQESAQKNIELINSLKHFPNASKKTLQYHGTNKHLMITGIPAKDIFTVCKQFQFPVESSMQNDFFLKLEIGLQTCDIIPKIDIVFVRINAGETRRIYDDKRINQLFQGHSPNRLPGTPEYYPGDSNLVIGREDRIQIQIHLITPRNDYRGNYCSPALAVYIPQIYANELSKLITRG